MEMSKALSMSISGVVRRITVGESVVTEVYVNNRVYPLKFTTIKRTKRTGGIIATRDSFPDEYCGYDDFMPLD